MTTTIIILALLAVVLLGLYVLWPEGLGYLLAGLIICSAAIGGIMIVLVVWGLLFMGFDWAFPTVLDAYTPAVVLTFTPFWRGVMFGVVFGVVRNLLR